MSETPKFNQEIFKKAQNKNNHQKYIQSCMDADVCPNCGKDGLNNGRKSDESGLTSWREQSCECGFVHKSNYCHYDPDC